MATSTKRDLSKTAGNPTHTIETHFDLLMAESDPVKLAQDVIELVRRHGGLSENNFRKFKYEVSKMETDLTRLQGYLANYMLAGSGMAVVKIGRHS